MREQAYMDGKGATFIDPIDGLPDAALRPDGPVSAPFLALGVSTFRDACRWVRALPYGGTRDLLPMPALFGEQRGTCFTKHGAIVALAGELDLPVQRRIGFFRMTDAMAPGLDALLSTHGLSFLPRMHCFLESAGHCVDLTDGNEMAGLVGPFEFVVADDALHSGASLDQLFVSQMPRFAGVEPLLTRLQPDVLLELVDASRALALRRGGGTAATTGCCATAPSPSTPKISG